MYDIALDKRHHTLAATTSHTARFDRDARLQKHIQRTLFGWNNQNLIRPCKINFERVTYARLCRHKRDLIMFEF